MKTVVDFKNMKESSEKITMITAYDYPSAKLVEAAGTDIILVGDSLGMVVLGYDSTIPVTMADMIHHTKATRRGAKDTFIIVDMPFASYHISNSEVIKNAASLLQDASANAVKLEGAVFEQISLLTKVGIPVVAHLGLTPQAIGIDGTYKVKGKTEEEAQALIEDAKKAEAAGAFMLVLECVPDVLAQAITKVLKIPVIGIGASKNTDGQVLVFHDIVSYGIDRKSKFVKIYADMNKMVYGALTSFNEEVKGNLFPFPENTFQANYEEITFLYGGTNEDR